MHGHNQIKAILVLDPGEVTFLSGYLITLTGTVQNEVVKNFLLGYLEEGEEGASSAGPSSSASASSRPSPSSLSDYKFRSSRELQVALQRYFQVSHGVGKEFASAIGVTHAIDARLAGITGKGNFKRIPLEQIEKAAYLKRRQGVSARREL